MDNLDEVEAQVAGVFGWAPDWLASLIIFALAIALALAAHSLLFRFLARTVRPEDEFWRPLVRRVRRLVLLILLVVALAIAMELAPLDAFGRVAARQLVVVCLIGALAVGLHTAMNIWAEIHLRRFRSESHDNLLARKHATQITILRRVANSLLMVIAIAAMLMTFEEVRHYGVSLLASAGAAGLVAGLALQPFLKNLFAGIQLAVTQPIRIDDALVVEGESGNVEEITSTYVVVRLWDLRRLIVPLSYFIEQPFQNWTREGTALIGSVILYLDYRTPMEAVRAKVQEIVESTPLWDRKMVNVQVTDAQASAMVVRILATAGNSAQAWDLRCLIRERIIGFLQAEHPEALPRGRTEVVEAPSEDAPARAAAGQASAPPAGGGG